jgi:ubiquinone biosynthesis protein UbiJ
MALITQALLASAEAGVNRVLRLDGVALLRLARLAGRVLEVDCQAPPLRLFILPDADGLHLAAHHEAAVDCTLRAPAGSLLQLALARDKTRVLHSPEVEMGGDSALLLELADILQSLGGPLAGRGGRAAVQKRHRMLSSRLRGAASWTGDSLESLRLSLADYLAEESRSLVGRHEAEARFGELDQLKIALDRLDARLTRLAKKLNPDA